MTATTSPRPSQVPPIQYNDLLQKLDQQYEKYLHLLHQYTEARSQLSKEMSNGFLALAQANFSTQNRMRYGRDQYDERMQALRVVNINDSKGDVSFQLTEPPAHRDETKAEESELLDSPAERADDDSKSTITEKQKQDPLRWFGVLVPQALRSSQKHFTESLDIIVNELSSVDSRMKALEIETRRTKKHLSRVK